MSDTMLHGVLRMPPDLWRDDPIDVAQRHSRYVEASDRITEQDAELARLRARVAEMEAAEPVAWANWLELNMANIDTDERTMTVGNCEMVPFDTPLYLGPQRMTLGLASEAFDKAWSQYEAKGYRYGEDALEQVRFGFEIALRHAGAIKDPT